MSFRRCNRAGFRPLTGNPGVEDSPSCTTGPQPSVAADEIEALVARILKNLRQRDYRGGAQMTAPGSADPLLGTSTCTSPCSRLQSFSSMCAAEGSRISMDNSTLRRVKPSRLPSHRLSGRFMASYLCRARAPGTA